MTEVASFSIYYHQFLDEQGQLLRPLPREVPLEDLVNIYQQMVLTRTFDSKAINLQRTGKMGTYASILGQEAVSVVLGYLMKPEDVLAPSYREYGAQFQRGVEMHDILRYWGGDERGSQFNHPYDFPICVPIATQCLHAVGAAKAFQLRREERVAVSACGDGATSQGDFYEAMNLAGVWNLPVIFLVTNNQWAISVPRKKQSAAKTLAQKGIAAGIECIQVDGNDAVALHYVLRQALLKARSGEGATVIEALTYRLHDHTTADDATRYRETTELETARQREPLHRLRAFLASQSVWDPEKEKTLLSTCVQKVEAAVEIYMNTTAQTMGSMFDYLYADIPEPLLEQREIARHYGKTHHG